MMTVTELAKQSGTTADAVRYYTRIGLLKPSKNPNNGYRLYQPNDLNWLRFIRQAKALGYTLHEIQQIMHVKQEGHSPCPKVREILQTRIKENRRNLEELIELQQRMEKALEQWSTMPDGSTDGDVVCPLIESIISPDLDEEKMH